MTNRQQLFSIGAAKNKIGVCPGSQFICSIHLTEYSITHHYELHSKTKTPDWVAMLPFKQASQFLGLVTFNRFVQDITTLI